MPKRWFRRRGCAAANRRALDEPVGDLYRIVCDLAIDSHRRRIRENRIVEPATAKASETTADGTPSPETAAVAMARVDVVYPGPVAARPVVRSLRPERPLGRRTGAMARTPHCRGAHYVAALTTALMLTYGQGFTSWPHGLGRFFLGRER